ncbi:MAG TPA: energy transducer TonB [Gemmatimonadales bacterium]|nr:energy transducer TonB [Gemmatimonadales bacterium]
MRAGLVLMALSLSASSAATAQTADSFPPTPAVAPLPPLPPSNLAAHAPASPNEVFLTAELDKVPKLRKVGMWYVPMGNPDGKATVVMQAIVDTTGHIEAASLFVKSTTDPMFVPSARLTLLSTTFLPGTSQKRRVRVLIQVPLIFDGTRQPRCVGNWITTMLPPKCE